MTRLLAKRILLGVVVLCAVSVVVFLATQALPGDAARAILGREATPSGWPRCALSCTSTSQCGCSTSPGWATSSSLRFPLKLRKIPDHDVPLTRWGCR
ncbi:hypothetical protein [Saccharopolyspora spinosa]|uniref:hypothetical protein n=1 Tax=Saccharopolyspora spinosa TaxID=60894 RepID=UPI001ED8FB40|nr:hypothetical protein [Saccharopolyspora spinosa]